MIESWSKENQRKSPFTHLSLREPARPITWAAFVTLQLLDVYTTKKGMRYNCVTELNPLLPSVPTVKEMLVLKSVILIPSYTAVDRAVTITDQDLYTPMLLTALVVHNNFRVLDRVENKCNLR